MNGFASFIQGLEDARNIIHTTNCILSKTTQNCNSRMKTSSPGNTTLTSDFQEECVEMSEELNLDQYQVRTDLAVEARQMVVEEQEKTNKEDRRGKWCKCERRNNRGCYDYTC